MARWSGKHALVTAARHLSYWPSRRNSSACSLLWGRRKYIYHRVTVQVIDGGWLSCYKEKLINI